jgi:hypothetical protein
MAIVTPVDFDRGGLFKVWLGHDEFPVALIVEPLAAFRRT